MPGIDKYLVILQRTNDGNDLSPQHLKLLELGVNGHLNEAGSAAVDKLYESVVAGTYTKPYHFGVEFMTYDHEGYIYFKDQQVEHYSRPWAYSLDAKKDLTKLQHQCLYLESIGELNSFPYMLCEYRMKGNLGSSFVKTKGRGLTGCARITASCTLRSAFRVTVYRKAFCFRDMSIGWTFKVLKNIGT